jgi:CDP-glucose 4,6-dehydratase
VVDPAFWRGRRVLVTGHTGFKGAWLSLWLQELGAEVVGLSLADPPTSPSLYELARVGDGMADSVVCDIRDAEGVERAFESVRPEVVMHLAAQPLVRRSFEIPRGTFETNVMGTVNVLEAVRGHDEVRAVVIVTSDKCYENHGLERGYREDDPMGGHDPYSSSKGAAELIVSSYRRSFFSDPDGTRIASARAGNVIGGGDWGKDRLVPDMVRAAIAGETLRLRNPRAVRPWQHVINPLSGYLTLVQALYESFEYNGGWNFGPVQGEARTVEWVVERISSLWPGGVSWVIDGADQSREAHYLELDSSQAGERLGWQASLGLHAAIEATVAWHRLLVDKSDMREVTLDQLRQHGRC